VKIVKANDKILSGLALALSGLLTMPAIAQQSAFQSADGKTSLYLGSGGAATFNFGDDKFSVGHQFHASNKNPFWGYDLFGKASSGSTTIFSSKIKVPEGGGDLFVGWHHDSEPVASGEELHHEHTGAGQAHWLLMDIGYARSVFYVSPTPVPIDSAKRNFDRFRAIGAYNWRANGWFMLGVAAGAERRNNLDDLQQVTFESSIVPAPVGTATSIVKTQAGFLGTYRQYLAAPVYTDMLFILPEALAVPGIRSRIAIDAFSRSDVAAVNRSADGGIGIFVTKKGAPSKAIGGVAASWNDGKVRVALVASYAF
jgi:hypothetical protein